MKKTFVISYLVFVSSLFVNCGGGGGGGSGMGLLALAGGGNPTPDASKPAPSISILYNGSALESGGTIDLGTEISNTSSGKSVSVQVTNKGTGSLSLTGSPIVEVIGTNASQFTIIQPSSSSIAANQSVVFQIVFKPTSAGNKSASLQIKSNDEGISSFAVNLTGIGGAPAARLALSIASTSISSNGSYSMGSVQENTSGSPITFTITNTGSLAAIFDDNPIVESTNPGQFSLGAAATGDLAVGATRTFTVTFSPTSTGTKVAIVSIRYHDSGSVTPVTYLVNLSGVATPTPVPTIGISHNSSSYTSGGTIPTFGVIWSSFASTSKTVTITNSGTATLTGLTVAKQSGDTTQFQTTALSTGSSSLAVGASATFSITFEPTTSGAKSSVIRITSTNGNNGASSSADLTVQGTGKTGADVLVSWTATNEKAVNDTDGGYKICYSKSSGFAPSGENGTTIFCDNVPNAGGTTPNSKAITVNSYGTWYIKVYAFGKYNTTGGTPSTQVSVVVPQT